MVIIMVPLRPEFLIRCDLGMYFAPVNGKTPQHVDLDICTSRQLVLARPQGLGVSRGSQLREWGGIDRYRLLEQAPE